MLGHASEGAASLSHTISHTALLAVRQRKPYEYEDGLRQEWQPSLQQQMDATLRSTLFD